MNHKPGILSILQNDSWAAPVLAAFIVSLTMTIIVLATNQFVGNLKSVNVATFIWMTGISFFASIFTSIQRVRYVTNVFENGLMIKAQVIKTSHFRTNLKMKLQYTYLSQTHEKTLEQVITFKTKNLSIKKKLPW
jgi:hypothetical protein